MNGSGRRKKHVMKKICIYCEKWASGGIESFLFNVITHMNLESSEIDIVAACVEESVFTEKLRSLGIHFFGLSGSRNHMYKNRKLFLQLAKERHYDVLHVNAFHGGSFYYLHLAKNLKIPVRIAHGHCAGLNSGKYAWLKEMIHRCAKKMFARDATELWACSRAAETFMYPKGEHYRNMCRIILNGIDIERFRFQKIQRLDMRRKMGLSDQFVVGTVGRLCREKNQMFLLDVFSDVLKMQPNSTLLFVGEGAEYIRLMQRAKELKIDQNVVFYGTTDRVEQLLWVMDVFVFPSLVEGLGLAAIEAQTAGLPVLCSDAIPTEAYILSTVQSISLKQPPEKWAQAVLELQNSNACREACADLVREAGFDSSDIAEQIAVTYENEEQ